MGSLMGQTGKDQMTMYRDYFETSDARQKRIEALVRGKWPTPLTPNQFVNTILDIARGGFDTVYTYADTIEAIDALAYLHLEESLKWGKKEIE